jgi:hypothetical protein
MKSTSDSRIDRRQLLQAGAALCAPVLLDRAEAAGEPETLYNGIVLPQPWPPRNMTIGPEPMPVPYLEHPPADIPIDLGRQLLVDDFLIEQTDLKRSFHQAQYHPATPVLKPDQPWELEGGPTAMPFSDGVWYDPKVRLFKLWYMSGYGKATALAVSEDGVQWRKPQYDVRPGTNVVHPEGRDSAITWLDLEETDPERRSKLFRSHSSEGRWGVSVHFSPDGVHWSERRVRTGPAGDRTTAFWNPFRKVWVYSLRNDDGAPRRRRYWETKDLVNGPMWTGLTEPPLWVGADRLDPQREDLKTPTQLYNLDCVAYESLMLGLFSIWYGQPRDRAKPNQVLLGFSRDGFHWHRPDRRPFLPVSERHGDWNWGNVQSAGGGCLVVGDLLYFYCSARAGVPGSTASGVCTTGLATLRRDGFASMDAGDREGTLTTRPVRFSGNQLFVNADMRGGELRVEALDMSGSVIRPFTKANSIPVHSDRTLQKVSWKGDPDLDRLKGRPVRLRFTLRQGSLYAFWISRAGDGRSSGYVAAGGPGFTGPADA